MLSLKYGLDPMVICEPLKSRSILSARDYFEVNRNIALGKMIGLMVKDNSYTDRSGYVIWEKIIKQIFRSEHALT